MGGPRRSRIWFGMLLVAGAGLAAAVLSQTVATYRYIADTLLVQEARRISHERVRNVERGARFSRPRDAESFRAILDDVRSENADHVAWIALLQVDRSVLASSGRPDAVATSGEPPIRLDLDTSVRTVRYGDGETLVTILPCRCGIPRDGENPGAPRSADRLFVEVGLDRTAVSMPFARVRQYAASSASAAIALLLSLLLIASRFGPYLRGTQLDAQMNVARQVQRDLLPPAGAPFEGIEVAAECVPAWQIGGDFYDIVRLPGGTTSFALGDVSGHGVSAALLMALIHGAMSAPPWGAPGQPAQRGAAQLNDLLLTKSSGARFASLFWCAYDPTAGTLEYLNAGHLPGVRFSRSADGAWSVERLAEGGPVIGIIADAAYRATTIPVLPGDLVVLFSDGLTEAVDDKDEQFGDARLIDVARRHADRPARDVCDAIFVELRRFTGGTPSQDDQTVLVARL